MPRSFKRRAMAAAVALCIGWMGAMPAADGAPIRGGTRTWIGDGTTSNWSNGGNWDGNDDIASGSTLIFGGSGRLSNINNLPNADNPLGGISVLAVNGLTFAAGAGAFTITGNAITSTGNISNLSQELQRLDTPLTVSGTTPAQPQTWDGGSAGLFLGGALTVGNQHLILRNVSARNISATVNVGSGGSGAVHLASGAEVVTRTTNVGVTSGSNGSISFAAGSGSSKSTWETRGLLNIGGQGTGSVTISQYGTLTAGALDMGQNGSLILDGGTLNVGNATGAVGRVRFNSGLMNVLIGLDGRPVDLSVGGVLLANGTTLGSGSTLRNPDGKLTISPGQILSLAGGRLEIKALNIGGTFNWTAGDLILNSPTALMDGVALPMALDIGPGKTLTVTGDLDVNGRALSLTGGAIAATRLLNLPTTGGARDLWWTAGSLSLGGNAALADLVKTTLHLGTGKSLSVAGTLTVDRPVQLTGGELSIGQSSFAPSSPSSASAWTSGSLTFSGAAGGTVNSTLLQFIGPDGLLPGMRLTALNNLSFATTLRLAGGTLEIGSMSRQFGGTLDWRSGTIRALNDFTFGVDDGGLIPSTRVLDDQHRLEVGGTLRLADRSLTLGSGVLTVGRLSRLDPASLRPGTADLQWLGGTLRFTQSFDNYDFGLPALNVGAGHVLDATRGLTSPSVGSAGSRMTLAGGLVRSTFVDGFQIERTRWSSGAFEFSGDLRSSDFQFNTGSTSLNTLLQGQVLSVTGAFTFDPQQFTLAGGELRVGSAQFDPARPGNALQWTSGRLAITGNAGARLGAGILPAQLTLGGTQTLEVANALTIGVGQDVALAGGVLKAGQVLNAGAITGYGAVIGAISSRPADIKASITASGGSLTLGDPNLRSGYGFGGLLEVGTNDVTIRSADEVRLGGTTTIANGGRLITNNGANLSTGGRLRFSGNSSILGNFTNNGNIEYQPNTTGTLSFLNDVNGTGSFRGDMVFHAGYSPGNSPATVNHHGGNVTFDSTSVLTMEIFGPTPGTEYDQLVGINELTFNGRLSLVFGNGFTPATGSRFSLLAFQSFAGSLAPNRIDVSGIARDRLNLSHLDIDGSIDILTLQGQGQSSQATGGAVLAVPEPGTYAMLAAGLGLMGFVVRRRRTRVGAPA